MAGDTDVYNRLDDKLDRVSGDISIQLQNYVKKEELNHYATVAFVWKTVVGVITALLTGVGVLCTAYWLLTPVIIDGKTSKLNENVDKILESLVSKKK